MDANTRVKALEICIIDLTQAMLDLLNGIEQYFVDHNRVKGLADASRAAVAAISKASAEMQRQSEVLPCQDDSRERLRIAGRAQTSKP